MIYALKVFNLVPGRQSDYRDYSVKASWILDRLGGRVVSAGTGPLRKMHGDRTRRQMIVVEFPGIEAFRRFIDEAGNLNVHALREDSTSGYVWPLYEPCDLKRRVREGRV